MVNISNQVIRVTGVTVTATGGNATINANGGTLQLIANVLPANATDKSVTWSVINGTGQATISSSGLMTAVANGTVTARATAKDGSGIFGSLVITISNQGSVTNLPPTVSLSSPTKSTSYVAPATITINAIADDPDGTIIKVEFYQGTMKLGESYAAPYSFVWKEVNEGVYYLSAIATDNRNAKTTSATISVVVEKSSTTVNQLPVVNITTKSNNKKWNRKDKVVLIAEALDPDGSISSVEFKSGNTSIATVINAPYIYLWEPPDTGSFLITALATDNLGATNVSSFLELKVVDLINNEAEIGLYPNPNDGRFSVDLSSILLDENSVISILRHTGQIVFEEKVSPTSDQIVIDISGTMPGIYVIMVTSGNKAIAARKFVKN